MATDTMRTFHVHFTRSVGGELFALSARGMALHVRDALRQAVEFHFDCADAPDKYDAVLDSIVSISIVEVTP